MKHKNSANLVSFTAAATNFGVVIVETDTQHIIWACTDCSRSLFKRLALTKPSQLNVSVRKIYHEPLSGF